MRGFRLDSVLRVGAFVALAQLTAEADAADANASVATAPQASGVPAGAQPSPASELERTLNQVEREARDSERRFEELGKRMEAARLRSILRGRALTRQLRRGFLPVGGGFEALVDHATRIERLRRGLAADVRQEHEAARERSVLAKQLQDLNARLGPLRSEHRALARAETALLSEADRERAFQRAFMSSRGAGHAAVYGALGPSDPSDLARGFAGMQGRLPFPIAGRTEVKRAGRSGSEGRGVELHARAGTPVRAVYPGRVAFADSYADYGKTVILDHGSRYYTVSAHLGAIDVSVGDEVDSETRLGSVGDDGQGAFLYFEIRAGSDTVDASRWFGL
ncbi:MAG TPA: peptidoglycan DD-metalloendopeptidase family protein [Polyangiaceae bacterium]|nr:peptidoglycan DD-metalloendopeptidase family protein [Polyangiaceae bacterium]